MGFSRPEYWSGFPIPSPGDLPDPGIKPGSPALQADSSGKPCSQKKHGSSGFEKVAEYIVGYRSDNRFYGSVILKSRGWGY